jgi:hypothetical protein
VYGNEEENSERGCSSKKGEFFTYFFSLLFKRSKLNILKLDSGYESVTDDGAINKMSSVNLLM